MVPAILLPVANAALSASAKSQFYSANRGKELCRHRGLKMVKLLIAVVNSPL